MIRAIAILVLGTAVAGRAEHCYGYRDHLTVMPDGSGKVDVVCSVKGDNLDFDYLKLVSCTRGAAAFTVPRVESKDGWGHLSYTVYFEDIKRLSHNIDGPDKKCARGHDECVHFGLAREGDGFVLTMEDWIFSKMPYPERSDWEDIRKESQNVVVRSVTLPGKVTRAEGFQRTEGRQATYERSPKTIGNLEEAVKWPAAAQRRIDCGKSELSEAETAAFRKELEAAKAAWPKIKADLEEAARKKRDG
jgi:hypothetical protein